MMLCVVGFRDGIASRLASVIYRTAGVMVLMLGVFVLAVCDSRGADSAAKEEDEDASPFRVTPQIKVSRDRAEVVIQFQVPAHHHLYEDEFAFQFDGKPIQPTLPPPKPIDDSFSKRQRNVFEGDFTGTAVLEKLPAAGGVLEIKLRGCSEEACFFKETRRWQVGATGASDGYVLREMAEGAGKSSTGGSPLGKDLHVAGKISGYVSPAQFVQFLTGGGPSGNKATDGISSGSLGLASLGSVLLILLGGMALNLTPCVLPMIPINLAILGAGAQGGDRHRRFVLGGIYGAGMALAYGGLGLAVVLAGAKFGSLNASPWFNFAIAAIFAVLSLAMFDKISIDFTRFQKSGGGAKASQAGAYGAAAVMGFVSALLAGACVAPVVISVLLVSTTLYQDGHWHGLLLPFILGLGMALPWPFAAAGLSFLPKPGMWMTRVKHVFGVMILLFAGWYVWIGIGLLDTRAGKTSDLAETQQSIDELKNALASAKQSGKPVLVDFWASWCKNCSAMEHTTLKNPEVVRKLAEVQVVRIRAEHLSDDALKPVLDQLGVMGLPTFVLLKP